MHRWQWALEAACQLSDSKNYRNTKVDIDNLEVFVQALFVSNSLELVVKV